MFPLVLLIAALAGAQDDFISTGAQQDFRTPDHQEFRSAAPQVEFRTTASGDFICPHDDGFYPHEFSCDQYYACEAGIATLKTCGNGLAFQDNDPQYVKEECDYLYNVNCGHRTEIAPAQSTENCDYLHGVFPDHTDCEVFWSCWEGEATRYECGPGLAYDRRSRICTWSDKVTECAQQRSDALEISGFQCPAQAQMAPGTFTRHPHPEDCRQFFVCFDNTPREYGCPIGTVFQIGSAEGTGQCADPQTVQGCENYYGEADVTVLKTLGL